MSDSDNPLPNGFLVKIGSKPRYFANKKYCSAGRKIKITSPYVTNLTSTDSNNNQEESEQINNEESDQINVVTNFF